MKEFIDDIECSWRKKQYGKCIAMCIIIILLLMLAIVVLRMLFEFIRVHYKEIVTYVGGFVLIFYAIWEHYSLKKQERMDAIQQERQMQEEADADIIERNYRLVRMALFSVIQDMSDVLGVKMPVREGEIDSPNHTIRKLNFVLYQYIVYRTADTKNTEIIKSVLRQEMARRLDAHLIAGVSQTYYLYEGQAEPIISVYAVEDNNTYLTISVGIADENYCRHIRQRASLHLLQQAEQIRTPYDEDF